MTLHSAAATGDLSQAGAVHAQLTKGQRQMVMLAEHYDFIIGGDPDRDTIDKARHRLSRSGDRQLNSALHTIAITQIRTPGSRGTSTTTPSSPRARHHAKRDGA